MKHGMRRILVILLHKIWMKYTCIVSGTVRWARLSRERISILLLGVFLCVLWLLFFIRFEFVVYFSIILFVAYTRTCIPCGTGETSETEREAMAYATPTQFTAWNIYYSCGIAHCMQLIFKNCSFSCFIRLLPLLQTSIQSHTCRIN